MTIRVSTIPDHWNNHGIPRTGTITCSDSLRIICVAQDRDIEHYWALLLQMSGGGLEDEAVQ